VCGWVVVVVAGRLAGVEGRDSEPSFVRRFGVDDREGAASSTLNFKNVSDMNSPQSDKQDVL